jgi:hypothetical protein
MGGREGDSLVIVRVSETVGWAKRPKAACPRVFNKVRVGTALRAFAHPTSAFAVHHEPEIASMV